MSWDIFPNYWNGRQINARRNVKKLPPERQQAGREFRSANVFGSRTALQAVSDGVVVINRDGRIEFLNSAAEALSGWRLAEAEMQPVEHIVHLVPEGEPGSDSEIPALTGAGPQSFGHCTLTARSGERTSIKANSSPVCDANGEVSGRVLILEDQSEAHALRMSLDHQTTHDALTGLLNRSSFEVALSGALDVAVQARTTSPVLLYLDVDQFKIINDLCGHVAGDQFLRQLSQLLRQMTPNGSVLARLGGDEFGVLLKDVTTQQSDTLAHELCTAVGRMAFTWRGHTYTLTVSIGVTSLSTRDDTDDAVSMALSAADVACFTAKDLGRNRVHLHSTDRVPSQQVDMEWVARILRALEEERLIVYSQPIVPVGDGDAQSTPHYELLLRLTDRSGNVLLPTCFIPAAERFDLMPRVDGWIVGYALDNLVWRPEDSFALPKYKLSINLSGASLSDEHFLGQLERRLERQPLEPGTLCFEITETATIANLGQVAEFMRRMKRLGCEFSLDDFGSGLSSFAYLKQLPVDLIKIDGDFIADLLTSTADAAVVDAIVHVAGAMGVHTVAERVESQKVLDALTDIGVDYAQGFLFARPQPVRNRSSFKGVLPESHSALA